MHVYIRVFFDGKTKSSCFDLFIHWLMKQITNTYGNHYFKDPSSRSYENRPKHYLVNMTVSFFLFQGFYSPCLDSTRWRYGPQANTETIAKNLKIIQKEGKPLSLFCCRCIKSNSAFSFVGMIIVNEVDDFQVDGLIMFRQERQLIVERNWCNST